MKAIVVYDTRYGNTEKIARAVADTLGMAGPAWAVYVRDVTSEDLEEVTLLVVGSPTQVWSATGAIRSFISGLSSELAARLRAAAFDTGLRMPLSGSAAGKLEDALRKRGCTLAAPARRFYVTGLRGPLRATVSLWGESLAETVVCLLSGSRL